MPIRYNDKHYDFDGDVYTGDKLVFQRQRRGIPITYWRHWYRAAIENVYALDVSVAVRHNLVDPDKAYIAYVSTDNVLTVKSAVITARAEGMTWTTELTQANCSFCSLAFDGKFVEVGNKVEFRTGALPYLFYTTTMGELLGCPLGSESYINISGNVTSLDAIHGVVSKYGDMDQGMILFYVSDGDVLYRELVGDTWGDEHVVDIAPANAVTVKAERTFDWRIVLHVTDSTGSLYEVFGRAYVSGWSNIESISASVRDMTVEVYEINEQDSMLPDEYIIASVYDMPTAVYKTESPVMYDAHNYAVEVYDEETEEYSDNYGLWVFLRWDAAVLGTQNNIPNFVLNDVYNTQFPAQEIVVDPDYPNRLRIRFNDFNNAENPVTLAYTPGTLSSGVVDVLASSVQFNASGLVPTYIPAPEFVSVVNSGNRTVIIEFDRAIVDIVSHGLTITGQEPNMSPQGEVSAYDYGIESVDHVSGEPTKIQVNLTYAGRIKHPQGNITITFAGSMFGPGNVAVAPFVQSFAPAGIVPWFRPNDPEYILVSPIMTVAVNDIVYRPAKAPEEYIQASAYAMTVTVTKVGELPL